MIVENTTLNPCTIQLTVEVGQDRVREALDAATRQFARQLRVPGFRPGKAPAHVVNQFVQKDVLLQRAAEYLIPRAYQEAVKEAELEPYGSPSIELEQMDEESPCRFTAKVPLAPKVELGAYKGLTVQKPDPAATAEEVERQLEQMRMNSSSRVPVDRPAQDGDVAVVDLSPSGEKPKRFMLVVGQAFPQLDQELRGMAASDTKTVTLTYPSDFDESDWAGKPLDTEIRLETLSEVVLPELNDELAVTYGSESLVEMREAIRRSIEALKAAKVQEYVVDQLFTQLLENSTVDIPDTMWESVYRERIKEIEAEQAQKKSTLEAFATSQGMTVDQLRDAIKDDAQMQVKRALLIREIAEAEKLLISEAEINEQIERLADRAGVTIEVANREIVKQRGMDEVRFRALFKKVGEVLEENATIVPVAGG